MMKRFAILLCLFMFAVFAQEDPDLGDWVEYASEDGSVTFIHPPDWAVRQEEDGSISIASTQEALETKEPPIAGIVEATIQFVPRENLGSLNTNVDTNSETLLMDLALALASQVQAEDSEIAAVIPRATEEATEAVATAEPTQDMSSDSDIEMEITAEAISTETPEPPFTMEMSDEGNSYTINFTDGRAFAGADFELEGAKGSVIVFDAAEGVIGITYIALHPQETNPRLTMDIIRILSTLAYHRAE